MPNYKMNFEGNPILFVSDIKLGAHFTQLSHHPKKERTFFVVCSVLLSVSTKNCDTISNTNLKFQNKCQNAVLINTPLVNSVYAYAIQQFPELQRFFFTQRAYL